MPITSKTQSQAKQDWNKENSKVYGVRVMKRTETDLWDYLQSVDQPATEFKKALRYYIAHGTETNNKED